MSFTAFVYGTPKGFEELFASELVTHETEKLSAFNQVIVPHSSGFVYQNVSEFLRPSQSQATTSTLWMIRRVWLERPNSEQTELDELMFVGLYRHAYEVSEQRHGFYGGGHWFNRHEVMLSGHYLVANACLYADAVAEHCSRPVFEDLAVPVRPQVFRSSLHDHAGVLRARLRNCVSRHSTEDVRFLSSRSESERSIFIEGSSLFVFFEEKEIDSISVVEKFIEESQKNTKLLEFETIVFTDEISIFSRIRSPDKKFSLPLFLSNARIEQWSRDKWSSIEKSSFNLNKSLKAESAARFQGHEGRTDDKFSDAPRSLEIAEEDVESSAFQKYLENPVEESHLESGKYKNLNVSSTEKIEMKIDVLEEKINLLTFQIDEILFKIERQNFLIYKIDSNLDKFFLIFEKFKSIKNKEKSRGFIENFKDKLRYLLKIFKK